MLRSGVAEVLASNTTETSRQRLANITAAFPTHKDWEGAANGIFLLQVHYGITNPRAPQEHYSLDIPLLAEGVVSAEGGEDIRGQHTLEEEDLLQIGSCVSSYFLVYYYNSLSPSTFTSPGPRISSVNAGYHDVSVEWLELAQARLQARRSGRPSLQEGAYCLQGGRGLHDANHEGHRHDGEAGQGGP
jgi:hypothetical protein